jgi:light-regulated signal transduction histidine kinase (bacteriophytochrome)
LPTRVVLPLACLKLDADLPIKLPRDGQWQMTKDKAQWIADSSHEMRNALTCIFQFGNILIGGLAGELSEEQRQYLGIMLENAASIRNLLDGLPKEAPAGLAECAQNIGPGSKKAH